MWSLIRPGWFEKSFWKIRSVDKVIQATRVLRYSHFLHSMKLSDELCSYYYSWYSIFGTKSPHEHENPCFKDFQRTRLLVEFIIKTYLENKKMQKLVKLNQSITMNLHKEPVFCYWIINSWPESPILMESFLSLTHSLLSWKLSGLVPA